jgi:hypothetical protein
MLELKFFPELTEKIESCVRDTGKRVVLLGHSMGNKVIHYYLNYSMWRLYGRKGRD